LCLCYLFLRLDINVLCRSRRLLRLWLLHACICNNLMILINCRHFIITIICSTKFSTIIIQLLCLVITFTNLLFLLNLCFLTFIHRLLLLDLFFSHFLTNSILKAQSTYSIPFNFNLLFIIYSLCYFLVIHSYFKLIILFIFKFLIQLLIHLSALP
jgi:hypothetical protein